MEEPPEIRDFEARLGEHEIIPAFLIPDRETPAADVFVRVFAEEDRPGWVRLVVENREINLQIAVEAGKLRERIEDPTRLD